MIKREYNSDTQILVKIIFQDKKNREQCGSLVQSALEMIHYGICVLVE